MKVILYSTGCPRCRELQSLLRLAGITEYTEVNDVSAILAEGFTEVPALDVDGKKMEVKEAIQWCKSLSANH